MICGIIVPPVPSQIPPGNWGGSGSNLRWPGGNHRGRSASVQHGSGTLSVAHDLCMEEISHEGFVSDRSALRGRNVRHHTAHTASNAEWSSSLLKNLKSSAFVLRFSSSYKR